MRALYRLARDKRGIGAIEFALVASLISVAALAGYQNLGGKVQTSYSNIDQTLGANI